MSKVCAILLLGGLILGDSVFADKNTVVNVAVSSNVIVSGNVSSGNVVSSSNVVPAETVETAVVSSVVSTTPTSSPSTTDIDYIVKTYRIASQGDFKVALYKGAYYIQWASNALPVKIVRGNLDMTFLVFKETVLYEGTNTTYYIDTVGTNATKYYSLYYNGGKKKVDINKGDFYDLVEKNKMQFQHNADTQQREVAMAQFGRAIIMRWYSLYDAYMIDLNYSGTSLADYNVENSDNESHWNYYIIDNISNLSSMAVYEVSQNLEKKYIYSVLMKVATNPETAENTLTLIGGSSNDVYVNNGTITNIAGDSMTSSYDGRKGMFVEGSSAGAGGGGGCFLR